MPSDEISAASAGTWQLGDLTVNRIGFGAMRLTGSAAFDLGTPSNRDRVIKVLRRAVELGVNHIDTAAFYFSRLRSANELINHALAPYPDDLVIATKVGPYRDPAGEWLPPARPDQLRGHVEENLRQLGRDHLDVVNLRRMPGPDSIAEHFGALAELREAGLIRHLGVSGVQPQPLSQAQAIAPVVCVQNRYAIDSGRDNDTLVQTCAQQGIAFVPFFALTGAGRERGGVTDGNDAVRALARKHRATPAQIRLAWTLHQGPHMLAIPGTGNPEHLQANVAAGALRLSADELADVTDGHASTTRAT
jgi:pyridoxine 4-dehydrogenase